MPRRSPPPPPSSREQTHNISRQSEKDTQHSRPMHGPSKVSSAGSSLDAFWSTQDAQDQHIIEDKGPLFDDEPIIGQVTSKNSHTNSERRKSAHGNTIKGLNNEPNDDFEIMFSPEKKPLHTETKPTFQNEAFNTFVADFNNATSTNKSSKSWKEEELEAEVFRLREQLKQANLVKTEITSKYEKLSAICRSQRQELQELKQSLALTPSPSSKESPKTPETPVWSPSNLPYLALDTY